ncbi:MaoC family dehydratase N-terminal domain-containing protein [Nocardioides sp. DS6]|uniref:MaoC family dehydratase N-terminal domain-containing protein n=1 Tax=Nocardioides eburneus TaxID=3231482 RepID=A0ABV3SWK5_9ACTN
MPVDQSLVGRVFPPTRPYRVFEEKVREFAAASGAGWESGDPVPATFPIVLAFEAMNAFLDEVGVELSRIVHGEQRFAYARPVVPGDVLTATLSVASLRQIGGNDIIGTVSELTDDRGALVCTATATLVHRGPEEEQ